MSSRLSQTKLNVMSCYDSRKSIRAALAKYAREGAESSEEDEHKKREYAYIHMGCTVVGYIVIIFCNFIINYFN